MVAQLTDPQFIVPILVAIAVFATLITLLMPFLERNEAGARMKAVALERDQIRQRERAKASAEQDNKRANLRRENNKHFRDIVERFNLKKALADDKTLAKLHTAGLRSQNAFNAFLAARFVLPFVCMTLGAGYIYGLDGMAEHGDGMKILATIVAGYVGFYLPNLYVSNLAGKRKSSIQKVWPDALDLMLICVESGITIEHAMRRAAEELSDQSPELAEEFILTTAELSYLQERRTAYENLGRRTGLESVQAICQALIQSERYGTPVAQALRVLAQESRDMRMAAAEEKAAALPPKLTVPMIVFFLPVLFGVVLGPAGMQVMDNF